VAKRRRLLTKLTSMYLGGAVGTYDPVNRLRLLRRSSDARAQISTRQLPAITSPPHIRGNRESLSAITTVMAAR
jgi:hypothetical protein